MNSFLGRFYLNGETGTEGNGNPNDQKPAENTPVTFTQEQVNKLLADNKKSLRDELDKLKKAGDPVALQSKIKELSNALLTKEELAKQEADELKSTYENQLKSITDERGAWENRFKATKFDTEVARAAVKYDAFDAEQLSLILRDKTQVAEITDKEGKGTGEFVVKTSITLDGKKLDLTLDEAVGKLREDKRYANQFKVKGSPGTGTTLNNNPGGAGTADGQPPTDTAKFLEWYNSRKQAGAIR
jgi:hypothetical protein